MKLDQIGTGCHLALQPQVVLLAQAHAHVGPAQFRGRLQPPFGGQVLGIEDLGHGEGDHGVAGKDGRGFTVDLVVRGPAPAQIVVVHAGQIVVDQRLGVDHLEGDSRGQGRLRRPADSLGGSQGQDRPQTLATGEQAVADGSASRPRRSSHACTSAEFNAAALIGEVSVDSKGLRHARNVSAP